MNQSICRANKNKDEDDEDNSSRSGGRQVGLKETEQSVFSSDLAIRFYPFLKVIYVSLFIFFAIGGEQGPAIAAAAEGPEIGLRILQIAMDLRCDS